MQYQRTISQSGTTHYVENLPIPDAQDFKVAAHRVRSLCEFHTDSRIQAEPSGKVCGFCVAIAKKREDQ